MANTMETQAVENKKIVKKAFEELWKKRDIEPLSAIISDDIRYHAPGLDIVGKDKYLDYMQSFIHAFENGKVTIEDQVAIEDKVYSRYYFSGKHTGNFKHIPATNKMVIFEGMHLNLIINGMIIKEWEIYDELGLMHKLGLELVQKEHMH